MGYMERGRNSSWKIENQGTKKVGKRKRKRERKLEKEDRGKEKRLAPGKRDDGTQQMRIDTERDDARERRKMRGRRDKKGAFIMKNEENIRISMLTFEIFYFCAEKKK